MASCTSNHFILIVLFSFLFIIKTSSSFGNHSSTDGILPFAPKHVVINKLKTQAKLIAHCRNKEKDLGVKELFPGSSFDFRFRVNLRKTTRYTCTFEWSGPSGNKKMDNDKNHKAEEAKPRLRWSYELHHRFIDAVNQLGGPNSSVSVPFLILKPYQVWVVRSYFFVSFSFFVLFCYVVFLEATPKGLMRILEIPELTLYHLKSHLQKYRLEISERFIVSSAAKSQERQSQKYFGDQPDVIVTEEKDDEPNKNLQIKEAIEIQLGVQKKLHEQIERKLQDRIEAQGKYLKSVLMKAQETLSASGYKSSSLYGVAWTANRSCLSSEDDEAEEEYDFLGLKKAENKGIEPARSLVDCSLASSECSEAEKDIHSLTIMRRSNTLQFTEIKPEEVMDRKKRRWDDVLCVEQSIRKRAF
ncbi:myb family transcription factor PHL8-like isoform X1 [Raphanus sativus]|uniref:Myb family transcription factor PHL8-like isoform X1 n=1 Tax=Raphanus sativus TaxID=3726 RepID=A0A9W3C8R7_RAPSA|nr:myb family transcription factor PHL8-like isoform X1 [Raphanus sativus]